jgi:DNA-binding response OmpR family regulator
LEGLTAGGDDYLRKPYGRKLLLERVKKGLRHAKKLDRQIKHGSLTLDLRSDQAFNKGKDMLLTHKEFALLLLFVQNEGRAMSAEHLYEIVWGQPMNRDANAVKNQVYNLRKKLAGSGYTITAVYREGYCFESE